MEIADAIGMAQQCYDQVPPHEAATCDWVIIPLLRACGYSPLEIVPQLKDHHNKFPDYTVLPNSPHTWFVEAKAWHVALEDNQVIQALNYANHNGKRWVVLSNGKLWRLYDNSVLGVASEKLITEVSLEDTKGMSEMLLLLGRTSIANGDLARFAASKLEQKQKRARLLRIDRLIGEQLPIGNSPLVTAMIEVIERLTGLQGVTGEEVIACLRPSDTETDQERPSVPPESLHPTDADSGLREKLGGVCLELISKVPGIISDRNTSYWFLFLPKSWLALPKVEPGWSSNGCPVLMWIAIESDRVKVAVEIGPGPQDFRERVFARAKSDPLFNPGSQKLYPKWSRIYRRDLVSVREFASGNFSTIENLMKSRWADFVATDLQRLEKAVLDAAN